jgi:hypothetical protein
MKKMEYKAPEMVVVKLKAQAALLTQSDPEAPNPGDPHVW